MARKRGEAVAPLKISIGLSAAVLAVTGEEPKVLTVRSEHADDALPSGPLEPRHRTLETGLRAWVEMQTSQTLGYVEQLYTFGDRYRDPLGSQCGGSQVVGCNTYGQIARADGQFGGFHNCTAVVLAFPT